MPTTAASRVTPLCLSLDPEGQVHERTDAAPPVDDRPHLRIVALARDVVLRDGDLDDAIAERDRAVVEVVLELVAVEPVLLQADARVVEEREPIGPETIRDVGGVEAGEDAERQRVRLDHEEATPGQVTERAAAEEARALHVVVPVGEWRDDAGDLRGIVLAVAGHDDRDAVAVLACGEEPAPDGGARAAPALV